MELWYRSANLSPIYSDTGTVEASTSGFGRSVSAIFDERTYIDTLSDIGIKASSAQDFSAPVAVPPLPFPGHYWWSLFN